jgi:methylmalonyl-CoA/ethylmalonyl-CoA epimerase
MDPSHEATSAEPITGPLVAAIFDHVAHAAPSIRTLLRIYQDLLGGVFAGGGDNTRVGYRVVHLQFDNGSKIELMEPLDGSTFFDSFFARMPHGGLHHVTFRVPDIRAAIVRMQQLGFRPTAVYLDDEVWQEAFLHPREGSGALVQLVQTRPDLLQRASDRRTLEDVLRGR